MKKIMIGLAVLCFTGIAFAQKDAVSAVFEKYAGVEGFTTVNISGDMLNLVAHIEEQKRDTTFVSRLSEVKILAMEDGCDKPASGIDLRAEVYDKLDKSMYKEMMSVKQSNQDVVILMRESNNRVSEILIIVGGADDNALIQVKGDMLLSEMAEMAGHFDMKGFEHLKKLEK
jgi:hypothetical protein